MSTLCANTFAAKEEGEIKVKMVDEEYDNESVNRTPLFCVTGRDTNHYTIETFWVFLEQFRSKKGSG